MATYRDEYILGVMKARLVPPDNTYPDCVCMLMLTEQHFYVLEDQYDGTYKRHFTIPIADILSLDRYTQTFSEIGAESFEKEPRDWRGRLSRLFKPTARARSTSSYYFHDLPGLAIALTQGASQRKQNAASFVRLLYRDESGVEASIFFNDADSPSFLARKLKKFKTQHALSL